SVVLRGRPVLVTVLCAADATIETDAVVLRRILSSLFGIAAAFTERGDICLRVERTHAEVFFDLSADGPDGSATPSLATTAPLVAQLGGRIETARAGSGLVFRLVVPASPTSKPS